MPNDRAGRIILWAVVVVIIVGIIGSFRAKAHEAASGWTYDHECCHDTDCAVATQVDYMPDGSIHVVTKHGKAVYERGFPNIKPSPDGDVHACFTSYRKYCLYLPTGV